MKRIYLAPTIFAFVVIPSQVLCSSPEGASFAPADAVLPDNTLGD